MTSDWKLSSCIYIFNIKLFLDGNGKWTSTWIYILTAIVILLTIIIVILTIVLLACLVRKRSTQVGKKSRKRTRFEEN